MINFKKKYFIRETCKSQMRNARFSITISQSLKCYTNVVTVVANKI